MARTVTSKSKGNALSDAGPSRSLNTNALDDDSDGSLTELSSEGEDDPEAASEEEEEESSDDDHVMDDDDNDGDFGSSRKAKASKRKAPTATPAPKAARPRKSNSTPRAAKAASNGASKTPRSAPRTPGPSKSRAMGARFRAAANRDELPIEEDNEIFNAVKDPNSALQSTAEDWVVAFQQDQGSALADLINFIIRTCGCNGSIDENQVVDIDNVVDNLEDLQEVFKKQPIPSYPIVSKSKSFKSFRKSLNEFLHRLVMSAYEAEILTSDGFMEPYQAWVSAMSSSSLRSFRHTSTVVALWTISAINEVNSQATKDLSTATKQRDAEKKKARADKSRLRNLETKVAEARKLKTKLDEYVNEFINSVFVHRFRDFDAGVRSECVEALGSWMKKYPSQYLQSSYFRYIGWVLSDVDASVRMAAVQAMNGLYTKDNFVSSIRHFTEMFKARLVQMATSDVELSVRVATIQVLVMIDKHDLLDEEQRDLLATHIFDVEPRIRNAVASFVANILEEKVSENAGELGSVSAASKKKGKQAEEQQHEEAKLRFKTLAHLLVKYGKRLDSAESSIQASEAGDELAVVIDGAKDGRIGMAVEALWDAVEEIQDWKPLIELLLLDHSDKAVSASNNARAKANGAAVENAAPAVYRLEAEEEAVLVEALVAILRKIYAEAEINDDVEGTSKEDVTRAMIAALPKLLAKYRTDAPRIADLLLLPQIMDLEMYTEMQEIAAFEALWDDVSGQIQRHTEPLLLAHAVQTIRKMVSTSSQSAVNTTKLSALEEALVTSLRETVSNQDVETAGFSEDEVHLLAANVLRLHLVSQVCDISDALEDDEGGQATSGWEIILGLASRGRLAYQEEAKLVEDAISVLSMYVMWKTKQSISPEAGSRAATLDSLLAKRTTLLDLLVEFVAGTHSRVCNGVQRGAFEKLLTIHMLYAALPQSAAGDATSTAGDEPDDSRDAVQTRSGPHLPAMLHLQCGLDVQSQCTNFIQAEIERYLESAGILERERQKGDGDNDGAHTDDEEEVNEGDDEEQENEDEDGDMTPKASLSRGGTKSKAKTPRKGTSSKSAAPSAETASASRPAHSALEAEHIFCQTISTFVSAIRIGIIDARYSSTVLIHYGRLGAIYDSCCKVLIEVLKEEAIFGGYNRAVIVESCIWDSLRESFEFYLDQADPTSEGRFVSLSRQLANALVVRGAGFTTIKKIDARCLVSLHSRASEHIAQKVAAAERNNNKRIKQKMPSLYKGMANLLMTATPTDAVKIKSAMDRAYRAANVQIPPTSKAWDAQRSYEKRLLKIAAKSTLFSAADASRTSASARRDSALEREDMDSGGELSDEDDGAPANGDRILPTPTRGGQKRGRDEDEDEEVALSAPDSNTEAHAEKQVGDDDEEMSGSEPESPEVEQDGRKRRKV